MALEIITHGTAELMVKALDGIAGLCSSGTYKKLLMLCFGLSLSYTCFVFALTQDLKTFGKDVLKVLLLSVIIISLPGVEVEITDTIEKKLIKKKVGNVPIYYALTSHFFTNFGHILAVLFETAVGSGNGYTETGMTMYSKIIGKMDNVGVLTNLEHENYKEFIRQCVIPEQARRRLDNYSMVSSESPMKYISEKVNPYLFFKHRVIENGKYEEKHMLCRTFAGGDEYKKHQSNAENILSKIFIPINKGKEQKVNVYLKSAFNRLSNYGKESQDIIQLYALRLAWNDVGSESYAVAHATRSQNVSYILQGEMAGFTVPALKAILHILFVGLFPIVAILALFPRGFHVLKMYLVAFLWVESWPVLFSILNFIVEDGFASMGSSLITNGGKLSLNNIGQLSVFNEYIYSTAYWLCAAIPFLSWGLIQHGVGVFNQLANHLGNLSQSAVGGAANEMVTGNYSYGNVSLNNHNRETSSAFKHNENIEHLDGLMTTQDKFGTKVKEGMGGNKAYDTAEMRNNLIDSLQEQASVQYANIEGASKDIQKRFGVSETEATDIAKSINAHAGGEVGFFGLSAGVEVSKSLSARSGLSRETVEAELESITTNRNLSDQRSYTLNRDVSSKMVDMAEKASGNNKAKMSSLLNNQEWRRQSLESIHKDNKQELSSYMPNNNKSTDANSKRIIDGVEYYMPPDD